MCGNLIDLCGASASGKTQLYTTIALNMSINNNIETVVIDTNGDFSGERIYRMLLHRQIRNEKTCEEHMKRIKIAKCTNSSQLIEMIEKLIEEIDSFTNFKMLVIDSMPALWFLHHGDYSTSQQSLCKLTNLLRKLAVEHAVIVLTINIATRRMNFGKCSAMNGNHLI